MPTTTSPSRSPIPATLVAVGMAFCLAAVGCGGGSRDKGPAETSGAAVDKAGHDTGKAVQKGTEKTGEAIEKGGEKVQDAAK